MKKINRIVPCLLLIGVLPLIAGCTVTEPAEKNTAVPLYTPVIDTTPAPTPDPTPDPSMITEKTVIEKLSVSISGDKSPVYTVSNGAELQLTGCSFDQAAAVSEGTILYADNGNLMLSGCTVSSGTENGHLIVLENNSSVSVSDSMIVVDGENTVILSLGENCIATLKGSVLSVCGNSESAVYADNGSGVTMINCSVETGEEISAYSLSMSGATVSAEGCVIAGNVSASGDGNSLVLDRSDWTGDLWGDEDATFSVSLRNISAFRGTLGENCPDTDVFLDLTSQWILTGDCTIGSLTDEDASLQNITGNGFNIYYNSELEKNAWLNSRTFALNGGGYLIPLI